jgi:hypothetical protein
MKKLTFYTVIFAFLFVNLAMGQEDRMRNMLDDEMELMESGKLTLRFLNALDGSAIQGAKVKVGDIGVFTTDAEGKVRFPETGEDGKIEVKFRKEGFIDSDFMVEIIAGTIFRNRYSISPKLDIGFLRVVVDWGERPRDLDAHFLKTGGYHISYQNMHVASDGTAKLDRDDTNGHGPETITVKEVDDGSHYEYYLFDYSNRSNSQSTRLSNSRASVKVYGDGRLLKVYEIPSNRPGNTWKVFEIQNGEILGINTFM